MFGCRPISMLFVLPMTNAFLKSYCEKENASKSQGPKGKRKLAEWNNDWDMMSESMLYVHRDQEKVYRNNYLCS